MQKINVKNLLRMQKSGQAIRPLHIILGNRNLEKFGEIVNIPADSIKIIRNLVLWMNYLLMCIKNKMQK